LVKKRMTAEDRRQSIIDATINVIARLNYESATTALIAKEAGVNEALIYAHFKSKKELQLAMLDYLIKYRLGIYRSNPVFKPENKDQSIVKAINAQYLERIQQPDVNMFSCLLKATFAIDADIRKKGMDCAIALYEFNKQNLIEDGRRGFFNNRFDPDIIAWELLGSVLLISTLAVSGRLDDFGIEKIKKSLEYFEAIHMTKK
jgi:AcrR family transcriptional regulator